jgi:hypothetical protein
MGFKDLGYRYDFKCLKDRKVSRVKGERLMDLSSNLGQVPVCRTVLKFDKVQYCDIDLTIILAFWFWPWACFMFFPSPLGLSCWHAVGGREALPAEACVLRVWWILCVSCRLFRRYFKMRLSQSPSVTSLGCCICSPLFSKQVESSFEATRCLFL